MTGIVWLRRAMRVHDNTALVQAAEDHDDVIPCYVVDDELFDSATLGYPRVKFWHDALHDLQDQLQEQGSDLVVRQGSPVEELQRIVDETDADAVYHNRDYTPYARERDEAVGGALDVPVTSCKDLVMFEKDEILTNSGTPYKVYSYYRDKWFDRDKPRPAEPDGFTTPDLDSDDIPSVEALGHEEPDDFDWIWDASRDGAQQRLEEFKEKIAHYDNLRDLPARDATSRLSPHLKFGTVSVREVFWEAERMRGRLNDADGVTTWQEELAWRDFYVQVLWHWPETTEQAFLEQYRGIDWHWDDEHQRMWQAFLEGQTGFPFVDAGMRQLRRTGWMHNRPRMVVASFAAKDLHVDWRKLHEHFKTWFVDAEIASMVGGIQWAYSIGTDAQPYFRVFNPWTQGEDHDPDGDYIREFVPELRDVPD
ncbi:MAG: deoxyribodipyrimidine photo-lyase, partial [Candidatus Nanohaloarchaea archaeon]|nr:deoxyribodipyrimidine photo-lyase [Candidatus Nanohaloarchaea archaeon]